MSETEISRHAAFDQTAPPPPPPDVLDKDYYQRIASVRRLQEYGVDAYSPEQLQQLEARLEKVPEVVDYQRRPVTTMSIRSIIARAKEIAEREPTKKRTEAVEVMEDLFGQLLTSVDRYVTRIQNLAMVSDVQRFHLDDKLPEMFKQRDRERSIAHDALMSSVPPLSRAIYRRFGDTLPEAEERGWSSFVQKRWFDLGQMKDRDFMEHWAVETDAFEKIQAIRDQIREALDRKNAGDAE